MRCKNSSKVIGDVRRSFDVKSRVDAGGEGRILMGVLCGLVEELVDSLDSGSSVHCGRGGSSPPQAMYDYSVLSCILPLSCILLFSWSGHCGAFFSLI